MKKLLAVGAIALFAGMNAQTEKGNWMVSGKTGLGFNSTNVTHKAGSNESDGPTTSIFSLSPSVAYFIANNIGLGLDLNLLSAKTEQNQGNFSYTSKSSTFSVMPTFTYFFKNTSPFIPYLGVGAGYGSTTESESGTGVIDTSSHTVDGFAWGVKGGGVYMLNNTFGLDLGLGYNQLRTNETVMNVDYKTTAGTFGVNVGVTAFLGGKK